MAQNTKTIEDKAVDEKLGDYLIRAREAKSLTLEDLSRVTGVEISFLKFALLCIEINKSALFSLAILVLSARGIKVSSFLVSMTL